MARSQKTRSLSAAKRAVPAARGKSSCVRARRLDRKTDKIAIELSFFYFYSFQTRRLGVLPYITARPVRGIAAIVVRIYSNRFGYGYWSSKSSDLFELRVPEQKKSD